MAYIKTDLNQPGIVELLFYKGTTGKALSHLAQAILRGPSPLSAGDRELIAAYVSYLNNCSFCHESHSAAANALREDSGEAICGIKQDVSSAPISGKMKKLLVIASKVQQSGREVKPEHIQQARDEGATDEEIHDTVLIASAFCMYNRYVDGLGTSLPEKQEDYVGMGKRLAEKGYPYPPKFLKPLVVWMMKRKKSQ